MEKAGMEGDVGDWEGGSGGAAEGWLTAKLSV